MDPSQDSTTAEEQVTELATIRAFFRLNARVRLAYLETILRLPESERLKDRGASYPSLQEIFVHVLDSLRFWFEFIPKDRVSTAETLPARDLTPEQIREWTGMTERIVDGFLEPLQEPDLSRRIVCHFPTENGNAEEGFLIGDMLWHMVEEEFQHRGELNALLWQMGVEPPIAGFDVWNASKGSGMY